MRSGHFEVQEFTSAEPLEDLRDEWNALWKRCPRATPFQTPEWVLSWWRHLGGAGMHTMALRRNDRLAGLAPFFIYPMPESSELRVLLIGTGITDCLDILLEPETELEGADAIFSALEAVQCPWNVCDFQELRPESPLLRAPAPGGWTGEVKQQSVCPVLKLPVRPGETLDSATAHMLEKAQSCTRRLAKLAPLRILQAGEDNFQELFTAFLALHAARWNSQDQPGVLAEPAVVSFHRDMALGLLSRGALRLYGLFSGDRTAACLYAFSDASRFHYYLGGFDPEFARFSPGTILIGHAIQAAIRAGAAEFDFLRGAERYKYAWGAQDRPNYRRVLRHSGCPDREDGVRRSARPTL